MGLSTRVRATALASLVAFSSVVNAQGYFYKTLGVCSAEQNHQYLGCATISSAPFSWEPTNWDPAVTADNSRSYIEWDQGDFVNNTITPYFCTRTCRAHGFKYAALWNERSCRCGGSLTWTTASGVSVDLNTLISATDETKCTSKSPSGNPDPCPGDRQENCGSNQGARVWVDPSFPKLTGPPSDQVAGYKLMGCFRNAFFPSAEGYTTGSRPDANSCLTYCANLGSPYAFMIRTSPTTVDCHCGADFGRNAVQATDDTDCYAQCDSTANSGCTGQNCCGSSGALVPVYANPAFMGCYLPVIPGKNSVQVGDPAPNSFSCFATPNSIGTRITTAAASYGSRTITRSATFVATASPVATAAPYVNFGCWQDHTLASIFGVTGVLETDLGSTEVTVETCVARCISLSTMVLDYKYAALQLVGSATKCTCATTVLSTATTDKSMGDCNRKCTGTEKQNCGGNNGPLVYARSPGVVPNQWADLWTSSRSLTVTYSCTPTDMPGGESNNGGGSNNGGSGSGNSSGSSGGTTPPSGESTPPPGGSGSDTPGGSSTPASGGETTPPAGGSGSSTPTPGGGSSQTGGSASPTITGPATPGITDLPADTFVILQVAPFTPSKKRGTYNVRRQSVGGFVGGAGPSNPNTCDQATLFGVRGGRLVSGTQSVATDPGVPFMPFRVFPTGSISTTFTIVNGVLHWYNAAFTGGEAEFCQTTDGSVYIEFQGDGSGPANCRRVEIVTYFATQCVNGQIVPNSVGPGGSSSSSVVVPSSTGAPGSDGSGSGSGSGSDSEVPEEDWVFREGHAPDNYPCYRTTESWVPGSPTFLPEHNEL
ncbi:hypothetical protein GGR58DRAFT_170800 [Xylaria digitata]|nr:hypothetical protein GGR58DRAFT_170800 [Xylaria digitata]